MTEELKKEAIQYAVDYPTSYGKGYKHKDLRIAYLASAEPREKRIAELEERNTSLLTSVENLNKSVQEFEKKIEKMKHTEQKVMDKLWKEWDMLLGVEFGERESEKNVAKLKQKLEKETARRIYNFNKAIEWKEKHRVLKKENAELKEKNNSLVASSKTIISLSDEIETRTMEQLTKAKEIIKKLIEAIHIWDCKNLEEVETEAEQFISEVEK